MRFRAVATKYEAIQYLLKSLQAACRLTTNLVFCINPNAVQLIADPSYRTGPLLSRCELLKENIFTDYSFKGVSTEHNLIYFDVRCDSLSNILHSLQNNAKCVKLKLANGSDGRFVLIISVEYPSLDGGRTINHNLYVSILSRKFWDTFDEQPLDPIQISLYLPDFKQMASTVDRLASLAQFAVISAKYQEDKAYFTIGLCNDIISIKSKFTKLNLDDQTVVNPHPDPNHLYKIRVDIRKLNSVFGALTLVKPSTMSCSLLEDNAICFHFYHELANFKILLPNHTE